MHLLRCSTTFLSRTTLTKSKYIQCNHRHKNSVHDYNLKFNHTRPTFPLIQFSSSQFSALIFLSTKKHEKKKKLRRKKKPESKKIWKHKIPKFIDPCSVYLSSIILLYPRLLNIFMYIYVRPSYLFIIIILVFTFNPLSSSQDQPNPTQPQITISIPKGTEMKRNQSVFMFIIRGCYILR